jgi:hypothetical protein
MGPPGGRGGDEGRGDGGMTFSYVDSELRRETLFLCGLALALLGVVVFVVSVVLIAFEIVNSFAVIIFAATGILVGRQMMIPAIDNDGYGYALRRWAKLFLRLLWLRRC